MHNTKCQYADFQFGHKKRQVICKLGYYGGFATIGLCNECIKNGSNTPEAKAALDERLKISHPQNRERISGCCDRADQA